MTSIQSSVAQVHRSVGPAASGILLWWRADADRDHHSLEGNYLLTLICGQHFHFNKKVRVDHVDMFGNCRLIAEEEGGRIKGARWKAAIALQNHPQFCS